VFLLYRRGGIIKEKSNNQPDHGRKQQKGYVPGGKNP